MELRKVYDELYGMIEDLKKQINGGGGSKDYDKLDNRPKVNNITLSGNKKSSDLKIAYSMTESEYAAATKNAESIYCLQENAGTITDSAYVNLEVADWTEVSGVYKQTQPFVFEVTPAAGWTIEDVSIETGIATVDSYEVTENPFGLSITYAAETLPEYGITATVTVTLTQPAGSTRIMKNGLQFGGYREVVLYTGAALADTMALSENIKSFDMVSFIGEYKVQEKSFHQIVTVPKSVIAAVSSDGSEIQITNDAYYIAITIDSDGMGLRKGTYQSYIYISKVIGIKF